MSNALFPNLPLICSGMTIEAEHASVVSESDSGRQFTYSKRFYPVWRFSLPFDLLRSGAYAFEYETLVGFFNARKGRADDFLFKNPRDYSVSNQVFGVGDGVTTTFELTRILGGFVEPIGGCDTASAVIKVNGTTTTVTFDASLSKVTFASAPAVAASLSWSGTAYYRCRFTKNTLKFKQFARGLYDTAVEFKTFRL